MPWNPFSKHSKGRPSEWTGFLDQGARFEGRLEASGTFRINGQLKGEIISSDIVILSEEAEVEASIEANQVAIAGRFEGTLVAKTRVEILPKGVVRGEIHTPCLVIEPGGVFDGRCHMSSPSSPSRAVTIPIRALGQG